MADSSQLLVTAEQQLLPRILKLLDDLVVFGTKLLMNFLDVLLAITDGLNKLAPLPT